MTELSRRSRHLAVVPSDPAAEPSEPEAEPAQAAAAPPGAPPPLGFADRETDAVPESTVPAIQIAGVGMRYADRWVLRDCTLSIPQGAVVAVVGRNGAGKTTLLQMMVGLSRPSAGSVDILGEPSWPARSTLLSRIGFVAQEKPLYRGVRVADMVRMGDRLNPSWDNDYAIERLRQCGVPLDAKIGKLSGGQRTQVALVMALAKRPSLLVLDEPLADLDPLARREVLGALMVDLTDRHVTVVLSSHVLADLTRVCDWLVLVDSGRLLVSDPIEVLLAEHRFITGPAESADRIHQRFAVVSDVRSGRSARLLVRGDTTPLKIENRWEIAEPTLEELVFAHLTTAAGVG